MKELLDKYKEGRLTDPQEQDAFVHQLLEIRAARAAQKAGKVVELKADNQATIKVLWLKRLAIAATLLLSGVLIWQLNQPSINYTAEIQSYSKGLDFEVRGGATTQSADAINEELLALYQQADYEKIILQLNEQAKPTQAQLMLLGIAWANQKTPDFVKALNCFSLITDAEFLQKATLLKGLCQIKLEQKESAKFTLQQIINDKRYGNEDKAKAAQWLKSL
jgi:hypothetical protein